MKIKSKISFNVFLLAVTLFVTTNASAWYSAVWTDMTGDHSFNTPFNWSGGEVPRLDPGNNTGVGAKIDAVPGVSLGPTVSSGMNVAAQWMAVGSASPNFAKLTVTGGNLSVSDWVGVADNANTNGQITMSGGQINVVNGAMVAIANWGVGSLVMQGSGSPVFYTTGFMTIGNNAGSVGTMLLDSGILNVDWFDIKTGSHMDIAGGTFIVRDRDGDALAWYNTWIPLWISDGRLTSYGRTGAQYFNVTNDGTQTVCTAIIPEPATISLMVMGCIFGLRKRRVK